MLQIDDKIISLDLFKRSFCCDIATCHGDCCFYGDSGAPLDDDETEVLDEIYPKVEPYLTPTGKSEIARQGKWVLDNDGDRVTPIISGCECVYAFQEEGVWKCAIERAYEAGEIGFKKPISCHLYPIRISHYRTFDALNVHEWDLCKTAFALGEKLGTPIFRFLREPLIRKFGEEFYKELESVKPEIDKLKKR